MLRRGPCGRRSPGPLFDRIRHDAVHAYRCEDEGDEGEAARVMCTVWCGCHDVAVLDEPGDYKVAAIGSGDEQR
jgi:hypothetical protein